MNFKVVIVIAFMFFAILLPTSSFAQTQAKTKSTNLFSGNTKQKEPTSLEKAIDNFNKAMDTTVKPAIAKTATDKTGATTILDESKEKLTFLFKEVNNGFITFEGFKHEKKAIIENLKKIKVASKYQQKLIKILEDNLGPLLKIITDDSEKTLIRIASRGCEDDIHSLDAETNCRLFVDFYSGVEFVGNDNFSEAFPRVGLRLRSEIYQFKQNFTPNSNDMYQAHMPLRAQVILNLGLTAKNTQKASIGTTTTLSGTKALEGRVGLQLDVIDFYKDGRNTHTLAILGEMGFFDPDKPKAGATGDIHKNHFAGLRLYYKAKSRYNGATLDFGWGLSEGFFKEEPRLKTRGYIPFRLSKSNEGRFRDTKTFSAIEVDSDYGDGRDELNLIFGISIGMDQLFDSFLPPLPISEGASKKGGI